MTDTVPGTASVDAEFEALTNPLRRELLAHCYRMLGSVQDAEDQVQETYLRAWRAYENFEGRSSVRTWMYTIATRTCLTALEQRTRRPMPTGLGTAESDPRVLVIEDHEVPWLEPLPDVKLGGDPENSAVTQDSVRLAFVAALQHLTPPQRAVLILRDVLALSAAETAGALETTVPSANSALQRARAKMAEVSGRDADPDAPWPVATDRPLDEHQQEVLTAFMSAFERYDTAGVVQLLRMDATWEMPPFPDWYRGREAIETLIRTQCPAGAYDDLRLVATSANGQPAAAAYLKEKDGVHRAFQIHVLDIDSDEGGPPVIRHVSCFFDLTLFDAFGLPREWHDGLAAGKA